MAPVWKKELQVEIVRFVGECQPNIVEARFFDSEGRCHTFVDKSAIFSMDWGLDAATKYPQPGVIRCQVLAEWQVPDGPDLVRVTTEIESTEGVSEFVVRSNQVFLSDSQAGRNPTVRVAKPMKTPSSDRPSRRSPAFWVMVVVLALANIWYDFRHPLGLIFDVVLVFGLLVIELRQPSSRIDP
jgi:hypothetical protein